jgi:excisionase family DNA binding protein
MDSMVTLISSRCGDRVILTVSEAASVIEVERTTLYKLIDEGRFPHFHVGGALRIAVPELVAWMLAGGSPPPLRPRKAARLGPRSARQRGARVFEEFARGVSVTPG